MWIDWFSIGDKYICFDRLSRLEKMADIVLIKNATEEKGKKYD